MDLFCVGDSWATKGFDESNHKVYTDFPFPGDYRFTDDIGLQVKHHVRGGAGNLRLLDYVNNKMDLDKNVPVLWVFTEPGRDIADVRSVAEHSWIGDENYFDYRQELGMEVLKKIRHGLTNEICLVGGLSDIPPDAGRLGFHVLEHSWQRMLSQICGDDKFKLGWGASDVGWRHKTQNIKPSKTVLTNCLNQLSIWNNWQNHGLMFGTHPTPSAHKRLADKIKLPLTQWIKDIG